MCCCCNAYMLAACCSAGCYTMHASLELYAVAFEEAGCLKHLPVSVFCSFQSDPLMQMCYPTIDALCYCDFLMYFNFFKWTDMLFLVLSHRVREIYSMSPKLLIPLTAKQTLFLKSFVSEYGARFYGLPLNPGTVDIFRKQWNVPLSYPLGKENEVFVIFLVVTLIRWLSAKVLRYQCCFTALLNLAFRLCHWMQGKLFPFQHSVKKSSRPRFLSDESLHDVCISSNYYY